jgi:hypothetical protein
MPKPEVIILVEQAPLFALGDAVITAGAKELLDRLSIDPAIFIARHVTGDWGELCEEDQQENERAVKKSGRVFSSYALPDNTKIWVITESDRSYTTILLPDEY